MYKEKHRVFEQISARILESYFRKTTLNLRVRKVEINIVIDILAQDDEDAKSIFEVKYYSSSTAKLQLLERAANQLKSYRHLVEAEYLYLIVNIKVDEGNKGFIEEEYGIRVIDIENLLYLSSNTESRIELMDFVNTKSDEFVDFYNKPFHFEEYHPKYDERNLIKSTITDKDLKGDDLALRLRNLKPGRRYFSYYERIVGDILRYMFDGDLVGWHEQKKTTDGLYRYDTICRIVSNEHVWKTFTDDFNSRYILFEYKNYKDEITQREVYTTEKYLFQTARRNVAIIISRIGASKNAHKASDGILRESGKLMLHLQDIDLINMLKMFDNGSDPRDYLFDILDTMLMELSK